MKQPNPEKLIRAKTAEELGKHWAYRRLKPAKWSSAQSSRALWQKSSRMESLLTRKLPKEQELPGLG